MMRTGFLVREITGSRLPAMVTSMVQRRPRSVEAYASIQNGDVTKDVAEVEDRPTKDIPGPKAWPLLGNMFRFMPYIGKSSSLSLPLSFSFSLPSSLPSSLLHFLSRMPRSR